MTIGNRPALTLCGGSLGVVGIPFWGPIFRHFIYYWSVVDIIWLVEI